MFAASALLKPSPVGLYAVKFRPSCLICTAEACLALDNFRPVNVRLIGAIHVQYWLSRPNFDTKNSKRFQPVKSLWFCSIFSYVLYFNTTHWRQIIRVLRNHEYWAVISYVSGPYNCKSHMQLYRTIQTLFRVNNGNRWFNRNNRRLMKSFQTEEWN